MLSLGTFLTFSFYLATALGHDNGLAITPQMGWNTWNHFGCDISENTILSAARAMIANNLTRYGYECTVPILLLFHD